MSEIYDISYYNSLPRKRSAVGALIFQDRNLLVLEPSYKKDFLIPGGVVEKSESPLEAIIRECREEIRADIVVLSLLCVEYRRGTEETGDVVHFLFYAELAESHSVVPDGKEIISFAWLPPEKAIQKFSSHLAARVNCGLKSIQDKRMIYSEDGKIIF